MNSTLTVVPVLVALLLGLSLQVTNIVNASAWNAGIEHAQPWRQRSSLAGLRIASRLSWLARWVRSTAGMRTTAAALALLAMHLGALPGEGAALALPVLIGDTAPTLTEVKAAIEASNRAFEEYKAQIAKSIEEGRKPDPEILQKLNDAMDKHSAVNEKLIETRAIVDRLASAGIQTGDQAEITAKTLKAFNAQLRATAMRSGRPVVQVNSEELKAYNEAFDRLCRRGRDELTEQERKALSVGSDADGGTLVSPDMTGRVVTKIYETSPMRQYAAAQLISTDALEGLVDLDEANAGWVSELGARTESGTPEAPRPWKIPVHEAYAEPRISQKLVEDAVVDVVAWLSGKVANKFVRLYNGAFVTGNGVGKPRGFASYTTAATADSARAWGVFEHVVTGSNGSFGSDPNGIQKLLSLIHAMKDHFAAKGAFYMNRTTLGGARGLTDASSAGKFIFIPSFQAGMPDTLLGYPVRKLQDMATYTTTDALAIAFGDMEACYQIVDRLGLTTLVDPYTSKPWVKYYTRGRVGGDALDFEAIKFLKFGS